MQRIIIPKYIFNFLWKRSGSDIVRKAFGALPPTFAPLIINTPRNQAFRKHTPFRQQHETTQCFYFLFCFYFILFLLSPVGGAKGVLPYSLDQKELLYQLY